jgi:pimeloyl-ACP methyl ester carboxylesterase
MIKNVVLVHGAWADGSSWAKIVPLLQTAGLNVQCVQNPLSSIADDVAATKRILDIMEGPVLLGGHSYGGAVITEAGVHPKVSGLMYVAAFAPEKGETLAGLATPYGPTPLFGEIRPIADGYLLLSPKGVRECFAQDLSSEEKEVIIATQAATQGALLQTPIKDAAWHTKPSFFVIAEHDRAIQPEQERATAARMKSKTLSLPTSHVPMLSKPREVAAFFIEAAKELGAKL